MELIVLKAKWIGDLAYRLLLNFTSKGITYFGKVLNVFRSTVNIRTLTNDLISITSRYIVSPIHIYVDQDIYQDFNYLVKAYDRVDLDVNNSLVSLNIGNNVKVIIDLDAKVYHSMVINDRFLRIISLNVGSDYLKELIRKFLFIGYICELLDRSVNKVILSIFREYILHNKVDCTLIRNILRRMIKYLGLGRGFTPSFDDFFTTFTFIVSTYYRHCKSDNIVSEKEILENTSWVSGKIILYAMKGFVPHYVINVLLNLAKKGDVLDSLLSLASIGHNSGFYMGLGILSALALIHKDKDEIIKYIMKGLTD